MAGRQRLQRLLTSEEARDIDEAKRRIRVRSRMRRGVSRYRPFVSAAGVAVGDRPVADRVVADVQAAGAATITSMQELIVVGNARGPLYASLIVMITGAHPITERD